MHAVSILASAAGVMSAAADVAKLAANRGTIPDKDYQAVATAVSRNPALFAVLGEVASMLQDGKSVDDVVAAMPDMIGSADAATVAARRHDGQSGSVRRHVPDIGAMLRKRAAR